MNDETTALKNRRLKAESPLSDEELNLKAAEVRDGLSVIPEITLEFMSPDKDLRMDRLVGQTMAVGILDKDEAWRMRRGTCVSIQYLGLFQGFAHYSAEIRPWLWFLTRRTDNRIFQNENVVAIIRNVMSEAGFSGNLDLRLSADYAEREYCVQYAETDYAFICRLMEEEGIYFFFDYSGDTEKMVLADGASAHGPGPGGADVVYAFEGSAEQQREDTVFRWLWGEAVTSGKVTLDDYDFTKPRTDLKVSKAMPQGEHQHRNYEVYEYPGSYLETDLGDDRAKVKMESIAKDFRTWKATTNLRTLSVGDTFSLKEHPRDDQNADYLVTEAVFQYQIEPETAEGEGAPAPEPGDEVEQPPGQLDFVKKHGDTFRCTFTAIPKTTQYRAPQVTPWPRIAGLQTAEVVGPSDEEIYTDEYGRIKVQFHWDRLGEKNENSSCWVRTMNPWTGRDWGMVSIPRIGQEVVIQFEEGDPDRPVVVGALYNDVNMPPYPLPEDRMVTGVKTNRYKEGGGFNELIMDDLKEQELVRFQSERDYRQIVKNNAEITIGLEHQDPGDLTQTIKNAKTETIQEGDHTVTLNRGDYFHTMDMGKAVITAATSIELICGQSKIKIEPAQITITTPTFKVDASLTAEMSSQLSSTVKSSLATSVTGSATVTVQGGLVKIN